MPQEKQYNFCLDFVKGIACICVVLMHCEFPGMLGTITQTVSRFCVPFFFMVSGYYWCSESNSQYSSKRSKKKLLHILKIALFATLFYIVFALVQNFIWHDVNIRITKISVPIFLIFNDLKVICSSCDQMWFLWSLLYVYIMATLIDKYNKWYIAKVWCIIALVLLYFLGQVLHLMGGITLSTSIIAILGNAVPHLDGNHIPVPNFIYRNWLIEGSLFFFLGYLIRVNKNRIKISNEVLLVVFVISTLSCIPERYLMKRDFGVNISSLPQVMCLFIYAINNPQKHKGRLQTIGKDCSMLVYVLHPFAWHSMERVYYCVGINDNPFALYVLPLIVVLLSILLAKAYNLIVSIMKVKQND